MSIFPDTYTSESFHLVLYFCIFSKSANQNRENTADVSSSQSKLFMWLFLKDESHRKQKSHDNISANHSEEKHADRRNI